MHTYETYFNELLWTPTTKTKRTILYSVRIMRVEIFRDSIEERSPAEEKLYAASRWCYFVWNASCVPVHKLVGASHFILLCADLVSRV